MGITVKVELSCSGCKKPLSLKGNSYKGKRHRRRAQRSSWTHIGDIYEVSGADQFYENQITITKGHDFDPDESNDASLYCSIPCAMKAVEKLMSKLTIPSEG